MQKLTAFSILALVASATASVATTVCYPRDQMLSYISRDFQATKQANGIVRPFSIMEVWVSPSDGDWLIVTTDLDGQSCILAYGEEFTQPEVAVEDPIERG